MTSEIPEVEDYPEILDDLYKFINSYNDEDNYLPDVMLEYGFIRGYPPELLADIVSSDSAFKLALELNCIANGIFRPEKVKSKAEELTEW
jgi:hypothetical protein